MKKYVRWRRPKSGWMMIGWMGMFLAALLSGCAVGGAPTWQSVGPNAQSVVSLALSSLNPPILFAGSSGQGLFRSQDGGSTWTAVNSGLPAGSTINGVVLDDTQLGLIYVGTDAGVFLSTNDGDHWQRASQGLPGGVDGAVTALLISPADPLTLYAGTTEKGIYVSHDGAKSWAASAQGLPAGATIHALLAEIKGSQVLLFAGVTGAGIYESSNNGASWSASSSGLPAGIDGLSLLYQPSNPGGLYVGTSAGIYRSTDEGASWKAVNTGLGQPPAQVFALALNSQQVEFLYAATSAGVFRSASGGAVWDVVANGIPPGHPVVALAILGSPSGIGTIFTASGQVYRYPSSAATASGQIFTFVILAILALLFLWLYLQQRRMLRRLTPTPPILPSQPGGEAGRPGAARLSVTRANLPGMAQDHRSAGGNGRGEAGLDAAEEDK